MLGLHIYETRSALLSKIVIIFVIAVISRVLKLLRWLILPRGVDSFRWPNVLLLLFITVCFVKQSGGLVQCFVFLAPLFAFTSLIVSRVGIAGDYYE